MQAITGSRSRGLRLGERVLRVFNSAETGYKKPHPEAYRRVLRTLGDEVEAANLATEALHIPVSSAVDEAFTAPGQSATVSPVMSKPSATP